jgi:hypothetical protein
VQLAKIDTSNTIDKSLRGTTSLRLLLYAHVQELINDVVTALVK